jgi:heavy metal translocating P-type ATPase
VTVVTNQLSGAGSTLEVNTPKGIDSLSRLGGEGITLKVNLPKETSVPNKSPQPHAILARAQHWQFQVVRWFRILQPAVAGILLTAGLLAHYVRGEPALARQLYLMALLLGGLPLLVETAAQVVRGRFSVDIVALLTIGVAWLLGEYFTGAVIVLMLAGGHALESYAMQRASHALDELMSRAPRTAHRLRSGQIEEVPVAAVEPGDHLVLRLGDTVPVDARVTAGNGLVEQSSLTGEPLPIEVGPGSGLMSGTQVVEGALEATALRRAEESQYERLVKLVSHAHEQRGEFRRLADRYGTWFTPFAIGTAALTALLSRSPVQGLAVLTIATPCPLILAPPVAFVSAISVAARRSVIVKSSAALETLGGIRAMVFDKTGTLTFGTPALQEIIPTANYGPEEVLRFAAAAERFSSHVLARAMVRAAETHGLTLPMPKETSETPGSGISAVVDGQLVAVGKLGYIQATYGPVPAEVAARFKAEREAGRMVSTVAVGGTVVGLITFADTVRPAVRELLHRLRKQGVGFLMLLTGDSQQAADALAQTLDLDEAHGGCLPQDKVEHVLRARQRHGTVAMVGDGVNDAPALATASVGIAMGARGAGVSAESADVVLMVDDVTRVVEVVELAHRTVAIARQGMLLGMAASAIGMAVAALGYMAPATGAVVQEFIDLAVVLNALRVLGLARALPTHPSLGDAGGAHTHVASPVTGAAEG